MSIIRSEKLFTGTRAERLALQTDNIEPSDTFLESDTGDEQQWTGTKWIRTKFKGSSNFSCSNSISA